MKPEPLAPPGWTDEDLALARAEAAAAVVRMEGAFVAELAIVREYAFALPDTIARDRMLETFGRYGTEALAQGLRLQYQERYINAAEYVRDLSALIDGMREARNGVSANPTRKRGPSTPKALILDEIAKYRKDSLAPRLTRAVLAERCGIAESTLRSAMTHYGITL